MKRLAWSLVLLAGYAPAQRLDPVQWTLSSEAAKAPPGASIPLKLTAKLEEGWHLYSLTTPPGGPNPTTAVIAENAAVASTKIYQPKPERKFDQNFGVDTETFDKEAVFWLDTSIKKDAEIGRASCRERVSPRV